MSQTLKEASLRNWTCDYVASVEQINAGSLQRIADATEKMALRYTELIEKNRSLENSAHFLRQTSARQNKIISSLRGQITKLKKKAVQP